MSTCITEKHRRAFEARTSADHDNFALFGCRNDQPAPAIDVPSECGKLVERGALMALNHSGGKDSQCMTILLSRIVPREQLLVVHAPLGEVEWPGTIEHIERTIPPDVPLLLARTASGKSLLERIEERGRFPSASVRYCTSDTKRTPIERELRRYLKAHPRFGGLVVNAMGMRASESPARAKLVPWRRIERNSRAGRQWFDWLPIHHLATPEVFRVIREAGQSPHWIYARGVSRCSCAFCILASRSDLRRAAELRPGLYRQYVELERRIGHTLSPTRVPLPRLTGIPVEPAPASLRPCERLRLDDGPAPTACPKSAVPGRSTPRAPFALPLPTVSGTRPCGSTTRPRPRTGTASPGASASTSELELRTAGGASAAPPGTRRVGAPALHRTPSTLRHQRGRTHENDQ